MGFTVNKGSENPLLRRGSEKGFQKVPRTPPRRVRPLRRAAYQWGFPNPKGPKIEKIQDRPRGLKFSIEIENFNLDTQQMGDSFITTARPFLTQPLWTLKIWGGLVKNTTA